MRIIAAAALLVLTAPLAHADIPDLPLDTLLAPICKDARASVGCPTCACEAVTQTPPGNWSSVSDLTHALVVWVHGELSPGRAANLYVAALGGEKGFKYGGILADASGLGRPEEPFFAEAEVRGAESFMDMCPGACPHDPVGPVHFYLVKQTLTARSDDYKDTETTTETLVPCFEQGGALACYRVPISESVVRKIPQLEPGNKEKILSKSGWKRKWSIGGPIGMELVLGKASGTGKHNLKDRPHVKDGHTFFPVLATRPDVTPLPR